MSNLTEEDRFVIKSLMQELLLLPGNGLSEAAFSQKEEQLVAALNKAIADPNWSDYLFYPSKDGLPDCMLESEQGGFEVNEMAIDAVIERIAGYKPIIL